MSLTVLKVVLLNGFLKEVFLNGFLTEMLLSAVRFPKGEENNEDGACRFPKDEDVDEEGMDREMSVTVLKEVLLSGF